MGRSLRTTAYVVAACLALALPSSAVAQTGGAVMPTPTATPVSTVPTPASTRVVMASPLPSSPATVAKLACAQQLRRRGHGAARLARCACAGRRCRKADEVVFLGADGRRGRRRRRDQRAAQDLGGRARAARRRRPGRSRSSTATARCRCRRSGRSRSIRSPPPAAPSVEIAVRAPRAVLRRGAPAAATYVVHGAAPVHGRRRRRPRRSTAPWSRTGTSPRWRRRRCSGSRGTARPARSSRRTATTPSGSRSPASLRPSARVRVPQRPLPDPRAVALRHRRGGVRRRARASGRGHVRRLRDAAGGGARRHGQVRGLPRARPATTS